MSVYDELGVTKLVNAAGTYTIIGGSRMSEGTLRVMAEAARWNTDFREFQTAVQDKIAAVTGNEAAAITQGAMTGILMCAAAMVSAKLGKPLRYVSKKKLASCEILMFRAHRNPYDRGLELLGVRLVELGYPNNIEIVTEDQFRQAFTENTAGLIYLMQDPGGWLPPGALNLERTLEICHEHGVPLVVDAAAQLPPKSNLWHFTRELGAQAVVFSGGKYLKGPQSTGLVLGHKDFIQWVDRNNFPHFGLGRLFKVGREELAGILNAVEEYMALDEAEKDREAEAVVERFVKAYEHSPLFRFVRIYPNEAGQPMARARLDILGDQISQQELCDKLKALSPSIFSIVEDGHLYVNPMMLTPDEVNYVFDSYQAIHDELVK